eukprot:2459122-Rhodomonas_salina.2
MVQKLDGTTTEPRFIKPASRCDPQREDVLPPPSLRAFNSSLVCSTFTRQHSRGVQDPAFRLCSSSFVEPASASFQTVQRGQHFPPLPAC